MNKKTEKYGWSCGHERTYGSFHGDNERCLCKSKKQFNSIIEAAKAGMKHRHHKSTFVFSHKNGYMGPCEQLCIENDKKLTYSEPECDKCGKVYCDCESKY